MQTQSVVALWRWRGNDVDFFFPPHAEYFTTLGFDRGTERYSIVGRRLVQGKFGLNPRSNARVTRLTDADTLVTFVSFNLNATEADTLASRGTWAPPWAVPLTNGLSHHEGLLDLLGQLSLCLRA